MSDSMRRYHAHRQLTSPPVTLSYSRIQYIASEHPRPFPWPIPCFPLEKKTTKLTGSTHSNTSSLPCDPHRYQPVRTQTKSIQSNLPQTNNLPIKHKTPQERSNNDANNDIPIIVHSQQHNQIRYCELHHMEQCSDCLLEDIWPELSCWICCDGCSKGRFSRSSVTLRFRRMGDGFLGLLDDAAIVFF